MIVICQGVRAGTREPMVLVRCETCGRVGWFTLERIGQFAINCGCACSGWVKAQATLAEALTEQEAA